MTQQYENDIVIQECMAAYWEENDIPRLAMAFRKGTHMVMSNVVLVFYGPSTHFISYRATVVRCSWAVLNAHNFVIKIMKGINTTRVYTIDITFVCCENYGSEQHIDMCICYHKDLKQIVS